MSIYIDSIGQLHHDAGNGIALHCPHCQILAHLTATSVPQFSMLNMHRPSQVGVVYRCDACNEPVFIKYPVKMYSSQRIELSNHYVELERPREKFSYAHLPAACEQLFKEALLCYSQGAFNAFASMCRRTAQNIFKSLGDNGRLKVFDLLAEIRDIASLDNDSFALVKQILFENDTELLEFPSLDARQAGMLLEIMKDLLYQCYIRRSKLQQAMRIRSFFAEERASNNVTPLKAVT